MFENQRKFRVFPGVGAAIALTLLIPMSSCVSNLGPLDVTAFYGIANQSGLCVAATSSTLAEGLLDSSLADTERGNGINPGFVLGLEVTNLLVSNGQIQPVNTQANPNAFRVDTHDAELNSLTTKYQFTANDGQVVQIPDRTFPLSVLVPTSSNAQFVTTVLDPKDEPALSGKAGTLTVQLTFSGKTADGASVTSTPADFNIKVCDGCLSLCTAPAVFTMTCGSDSAAQSDGFTCASPAGG